MVQIVKDTIKNKKKNYAQVPLNGDLVVTFAAGCFLFYINNAKKNALLSKILASNTRNILQWV